MKHISEQSHRMLVLVKPNEALWCVSGFAAAAEEVLIRKRVD